MSSSARHQHRTVETRSSAATDRARNPNDLIDGKGGDDTITAKSGDDIVRGGAGADVIDAGSGNGRGRGRPDDDIVMAGPGDDRVFGAGVVALDAGPSSGETDAPSTTGFEFLVGEAATTGSSAERLRMFCSADWARTSW